MWIIHCLSLPPEARGLCLRDRLYWGSQGAPYRRLLSSFTTLLLCLACSPVHTDVSNSKQFMTQKESNILAFPSFQHLFKPKGLQSSRHRSEGPASNWREAISWLEPTLLLGSKRRPLQAMTLNSQSVRGRHMAGPTEGSVICMQSLTYICHFVSTMSEVNPEIPHLSLHPSIVLLYIFQGKAIVLE